MKEPKNEVSRWSIFEDEMAPIPRVFDVAQEAGGNSRQIRDIRIFNRPKSGRDTRLAQPFCPLSPPTVIGYPMTSQKSHLYPDKFCVGED